MSRHDEIRLEKQLLSRRSQGLSVNHEEALVLQFQRIRNSRIPAMGFEHRLHHRVISETLDASQRSSAGSAIRG